MKLNFLLLTIILALFSGFTTSVQNGTALSFNKNREFKIVQFTDTHINQKDEDISLVLHVLNNVVDDEKPDLVIFTGDIVTENNPQKAFGKKGRINAKLRYQVGSGFRKSRR